MDEVVEPFVRWGALGIGATAAVLAIGVVVLGLVTGEPFLVPLALVPAALAVGGYLRWSGRLRP